MRQFQAKIIKKSTIQLADAAEHLVGASGAPHGGVAKDSVNIRVEWRAIGPCDRNKASLVFAGCFHDSVHRNSHKESP